MSKKFLSTLLVLFMVAILSFSVFACTPSNDGDSDDTTTNQDDQTNTPETPKDDEQNNQINTPAVEEACSFVSLDINPAISLTVDENELVVSVYGENEDGQVLLYEETANIVGKDIETAIDKIVSLAVEYGYLDEENKVVGTTVSSADDDKVEALLNKVNGKITASAQKSGLSVEIDPEGALSLLRDLEELKAKYPTNQAVQSLTISKFQLALSASEAGEISVIGAVEMDDEALIAMVSESHSKMEAYATEAYKKAKSEAMAVYDKLVGMATDALYSTYYMEHISDHLFTCYYGSVYFMYSATARGFDAIADSIDYAEKYSNYELENEQVTTIMNALGIEDRSLIEDGEGKVTIDSIEAYTDKVLKNMEKGAEYEAYKAEVKSALEGMEAELKETIQAEVDKYSPMITELMASVKPYVDTLATLKDYPMISGKIEEYVTDYETLVGEVSDAIEGYTLTAEELRVKVEELREKAEGVLELIKEDLSEEEWTALETEKANIIAGLQEQKDAFESAINSAAESAKATLEIAKQERKNNN